MNLSRRGFLKGILGAAAASIPVIGEAQEDRKRIWTGEGSGTHETVLQKFVRYEKTLEPQDNPIAPLPWSDDSWRYQWSLRQVEGDYLVAESEGRRYQQDLRSVEIVGTGQPQLDLDYIIPPAEYESRFKLSEFSAKGDLLIATYDVLKVDNELVWVKEISPDGWPIVVRHMGGT